MKMSALSRIVAAGLLAVATQSAVAATPSVTKAGLGIGGQFGEGALLQKGKAIAYYRRT